MSRNSLFATIPNKMFQIQKGKKSRHYWFLVGLFGVLLVAPNAAIIRLGVANADPFLFSVLRYALIILVTLPFLIHARHTFTRKNMKYALLGGVFMAIAVTTFVIAIRLSQASYVAIITLIEPIALVVLSAKLVGERITSRAVAGITLAAIGAMIIVLLPIAIKQGSDLIFYPAATVIALVQCITFPLAIIYYKKANESGLSFMPMMGISAWIIVAVSLVGYWFFAAPNTTLADQKPWVIIYSAFVVCLLGRIVNVKSYEHIGATVSGTLAYLETFLAILIPIVILNERISFAMVIGGVFVLVGVYVVEHHKSIHHKHHRIYGHK